MSVRMVLCHRAVLAACFLIGASLAPAADKTKSWTPDIPKVWDDAALRDWATPVAGLNVRPTHISAKEYYSFAVENLRTYPVYFPGREPDGYWDMLQKVGPQPLIEPGTLKTEPDWIEAGRMYLNRRIFSTCVRSIQSSSRKPEAGNSLSMLVSGP